jgi:hypothetical protein
MPEMKSAVNIRLSISDIVAKCVSYPNKFLFRLRHIACKRVKTIRHCGQASEAPVERGGSVLNKLLGSLL